MTLVQVNLVSFLVCCVFVTCSPFLTYGFSINLIPIDHVDKSLFPENLTLKEKYQRISTISRTRAHPLKSASYLSLAEQKQTAQYELSTLEPRITVDHLGHYLTSLTVGLHSYTPYLLVDTSSDDTWIQCEGCTKCFRIRQGNFKRNESRSYMPLPCNDARCYPHMCIDDHCMYERKYVGSGSFDCYSKGAVGVETFGFRDNKCAVKLFPETAFGCGLENHNFDWEGFGQSNIIAGVLGLGTGPRSILSQYKNETKMRMSYCLPAPDSPTGTYAVLRFGDEAQIKGRVSRTHMLPNINKCAINVMDISVAGTHLRLNPAIFRMKSDLTGGFILDSGSFETLLVRTAYNAVRKEIVQFFDRNYHWHPSPPQPQGFDLCYDVAIGNHTFPKMTYHFEGADLFLDASNIFQSFDRGFCPMMAPINDGATSMLGSFQQANFRFLIDFGTLAVSFVPEACTYN